MSTEVTVTLKDCERTFKQQFLIYEPFTFGVLDDTTINQCVDDAMVNFKGDPDDIVVRAMMVIR